MKVVITLILLAVSFAYGSPLADLASSDQAIRDKAASDLRATFKETPETKWTPTVEKIENGKTKKDVLELLRPFNVKEAGSGGSGQSHSQLYRLDDEWILICWFQNEGDVLIGRKLERSLRHIWVPPAEDFTGTWVVYFVNGHQSHKINYREGQYFGEFIAYHSNGVKACVQHYNGNIADGSDTGYHRSGKIAYTGQYKQGKQVGTWTWFDEDGKVTSSREHPNESKKPNKAEMATPRKPSD